MLLALYLGKQTMPASRIKEMKVHPGADGMAQRGQWGIGGGIAGRSSMDQLQSGKCGVPAFCLCYHWNGAEWPDRKLFWSGSRCIELSGAEPWRDTVAPGTHLHVSSIALPGWGDSPPFPPWAALRLGNILLHMAMSPAMPSGGAAYCADTSRAGRSASGGGGEWSCCCCLIQPGWSRDNRNIVPHPAVSGKSLPGFKDLPLVVKPFSICGTSCTGLVAMKSSTCCKYWEKLYKTFSTWYCTELHCIYFNKLQSQIWSTSLLLSCYDHKGNSHPNVGYSHLYNPSVK